MIYIYIILYSILSAWFNLMIIQRRDFHKEQALLRLFTIIGLIYLNGTLFDIFGLLTVYWIVFDFSLNLMRGLPFFYIGKTAYLDNLGNWQYLIKLIFLIILIYYYGR